MNDQTQTGVAMAVIAMVGVAIGKLSDYFTSRDKLRYDTQLVGLQTQNTAQAKQMAEQDAEIAELKRTHAECEAQHRDTSARLAVLERALADHLDRGTAPRPALPPTI